jgi:DNA-binding CsgD family transcriptional regulator
MGTDSAARNAILVPGGLVGGPAGERCHTRQLPADDAPVGRGEELALIKEFVARARTDGDALLVLGDAGVGKTLLLDAGAQVASEEGVRVLRARGVEFEAGMPFSGLSQALLPVFGEISELTATHRDALNVALGLGEGRPPERLIVSVATLTLLRMASVQCPLLLIIDDLPWLDQASAEVLGFAARRVAGSRIGFLAASRQEEESFFGRVGLPELPLLPLGAQAAGSLLDARFPTLASSVRDRILAEAQGNPLALVELPAALNEAQRLAIDELPATLPLGRRLNGLFASRLRQLPAESRHLLLVMAFDRTGECRLLKTTAADPWLRHFAAAEQAGLAYVNETTHRPAFRHPLIRSAVVECATGDERRRAHLELADLWAEQADRRAWHLAQASVGPDEQVAESLEAAAYQILRRGDGAGAIAALTHAAELSAQGAERGRRLAGAAYIGADVTGQLNHASQLLAKAHQADPQLKESVQSAVTAAFVLLHGDGDVDMAHRVLTGAMEGGQASDAVLAEALNVMALICFSSGKAELWAAFYEALERLRPNVPTDLNLLSKTVTDPVRTAAPVLGQLDAAISELAAEADATKIVRIAAASVYVDRLAGCRNAMWRVVRNGRNGGAVASAIRALVMLGTDYFMTGQWSKAGQVITEGVELAEARGYELLAWPGRYQLAVLACLSGDYATAEALTDEMTRWAAPRRVGAVRAYSCHARALAALGMGDFETAYQLAAAVSPAGTLASHAPCAIWAIMDLVEAAARTGRRTEAAAHVAAMRDANIAELSSRVALLVAGSEAIASPDDGAVELFEHALAIPGVSRWPFDLARSQLVYGERLRRLRATGESRVHLTAALETFERLGARPWAMRARTELRATGQARLGTDESACASLTPQERQIAELAAAGLTNKQIAERLFLSHRTVGGHLHQVFPKLGIATRAALRDALAAIAGEQQMATARQAAQAT